MYNERHGYSFSLTYGDGTVTQGSQGSDGCTGKSSTVQLDLSLLRSLRPITTVAYYFWKTTKFYSSHVFLYLLLHEQNLSLFLA